MQHPASESSSAPATSVRSRETQRQRDPTLSRHLPCTDKGEKGARPAREKNIFALLACVLLIACGQAEAAPIQGDIDFSGVITFDTTSLATATRVSLWDVCFVSQSSGDFAAFTTFGDNATMTAPWIFDTGTPGSPLPGGPLAALWQVGGFTFDLNSSSVVLQSSTFLNVTGVGVASGNGFDPTPGFFSFTASGDGSPQPTFSFQATSAVPEPGAIGLLAVGAFGWVGIYCRRRNRRLSRIST